MSCTIRRRDLNGSELNRLKKRGFFLGGSVELSPKPPKKRCDPVSYPPSAGQQGCAAVVEGLSNKVRFIQGSATAIRV